MTLEGDNGKGLVDGVELAIRGLIHRLAVVLGVTDKLETGRDSCRLLDLAASKRRLGILDAALE